MKRLRTWTALGLCALASSSIEVRAQEPAPPAPPVPPAPSAPAPLPPGISPRDVLKQQIEAALARPGLASAKVAVHVTDVTTGEVIFSSRADELMNPASNVKIVTSAAALAKLGPEYRFATDFACGRGIGAGGTCEPLYIKGRGDPALYTERIYGIAGELAHRGVRRVTDIVIDDTYFDAVRVGPGFDQERADRSYLAPAGAMSVNHNSVAVFVSPGETEKDKALVEVEPTSDYFVVDNRVATAPRKSLARLTPSSSPAGEHQKVTVTGRLPIGRGTVVFYKKIDHPPLYAGETFKAILAARGVVVAGRVRTGPMPGDASVIYTHRSPALAEIVRELNKVSNNFVAEQLLKTIGAEAKGPPGTWAKGVSAVEEYLAGIGIAKGTYVMKNGSGLNDTNRFSPTQIVQILTEVSKSPFFPEFASSLGIAGRDGTIRSRMERTAAEGRLRGKTGTLEGVTALSGFIPVEKSLWAYSILVNEINGRHGPAIVGVDALAVALAGGGAPKPVEVAPVAIAANEELRARVNTYANLGKLADKRNLPFLRSVLATERDPTIRGVVADSIYKSDPEGSAQTVLDNLPGDADEFARMRVLGQELNISTPMVTSIVAIAAEGNADALARTLELANYAAGDEATAALFSDGLQEVGRTAPEELYAAIKGAEEPVRENAIALLGRGLHLSHEKLAHPFLKRLATIPVPPRAAPNSTAPWLADRVRHAMETYKATSEMPALPPIPGL